MKLERLRIFLMVVLIFLSSILTLKVKKFNKSKSKNRNLSSLKAKQGAGLFNENGNGSDQPYDWYAAADVLTRRLKTFQIPHYQRTIVPYHPKVIKYGDLPKTANLPKNWY